MARTNQIKKALREGRIAVGLSMGEFGTRGIAKILDYAGFDWVMLDMEHSGWTIDHVADLIAWFKATPIAVIVRPPDNLYHYMAGLMDCGAAGIMAAHVESAEDAQALVDAVMYPPLGKRGVGLNSAHTDFKKVKASEYMPAANAEASIVAMIESQKGLDNVDAIAAVEGIDMIHASHNDLSVALGTPQQYDNPKFRAALAKVAEACKRHGKMFKFNPHDDAWTAEVYALGCRVMGVHDAAVTFQDALKRDAGHLRAEIGKLAGAR